MKFFRNIVDNIGTKQMIIYSLIAIICVVVIGVAVYFQFFYSSESRGSTAGINGEDEAAESEIETIKAQFNSTFSNTVRKAEGEVIDVKKIDSTKDIVYTMYNVKIYSENNYDININLPAINIDNEAAKAINTEIDQTFGKKTNSVVQSRDIMSVYNIDYVAYFKDDILSLVIKATLKELDYAQRVIIKTYNYNVKTNQEVTLGNFFVKKNLDKNKVYSSVVDEIRDTGTRY